MTSPLRVLSALCVLLFIAFINTSALAVTPDDYDPNQPALLENDHLYAESAYLIDMDTGEQLLSKNSRVRVYPASTTKIMTLLLAVESDISLDQMVTIPPEAGNVPEGSSVIGIKPGDVMTWGDLLYGFMLRSGNDGSNAIAVLSSGSIDAFVQRMNLRAVQLGCEGTHFVNAHGYHDQDHYTTAQDLAKISMYAMQNETFRKIVGTPHYTITVTRGGKTASTDAENRNSLLLPETKYYYQGATGIKTGHHSKAGRCVVASAERDGVRLLAVVMDTASEERQFADAHKLFNYGFSQYSPYRMSELLNNLQGEICQVHFDNAIETDVAGGDMLLRYGTVTGGESTKMIHRNSDVAMQAALEGIRADMTIEWNRDFVAPVEAGEVVGVVRFTAPDGTPVSAELVASRSIEAKPEPTPTPEPTPVPTLDVGGDEDNGEVQVDNPHNREMVRVIVILLIVALLLLMVLLIGSQVMRRRRRRRRMRRRTRRGTPAAKGGTKRQSGKADKAGAAKKEE